MKKVLFVILSVVVISGLIISGCSKPATTTAPAQTTAPATTVKTTSPAATPKPQPVSGGTLRIIIASTPSNLGDPGSTGRSPYVGVWSYVESLVLFDTKGNVVPWLAPYDPYLTDVLNILAKPSLTHFLGTDVLGRDTLSRLIYGARTALTVGILTVTIGTSIGIILGLIAGYFGGAVSMVIMRLMDMLLSFPMLLLALLIASLLGGGIQNVIIALSIGTVAPYSRIVNGQTLSAKENDYVMAERAMGSSNARIILRHILLNIVPTIIVLVTMQLGTLILAEASLSFLGIGIRPPGAAWGSMINDGYKYLIRSPVLCFAPGICIMLVVFGFMMVGDGLRDALDPRLRGTL